MIKVEDKVRKDATITKLTSNIISHEHDFVSTHLDNSKYSFLNCLTCDAYFCSLCGRMLDNMTDSKFSVRRHIYSYAHELSTEI
jgi:transcription initiation factor IIE alpha subunit